MDHAHNSVIFGANSVAQSAIRERGRKRQRPHPDHHQQQPLPLTYLDVFLCGAGAGGANALVVAPVELVRNRLVVLKASCEASCGGSGRLVDG